MASEKFRRQLRQEVEQWQSEGLIDPSLYEQLARRYQFHRLDAAARNRFILILLGFGSLLLGLAAIAFVAANWQVWSREVKVVLLLGAFVGINVAGFWGWRYPGDRWQSRVGQGLLLLGALMLGANIALMSQMFHQSGPIYQLYLVWGAGVLAMAYSLRLTMLGFVALVLAGLGYCLGIRDLYPPEQWSGFQLALQHMPLLAIAFAVPLALGCRSRWLFGLGMTLAIVSWEVNLQSLASSLFDRSVAAAATVAAIACVLPPALLWAWSDRAFKPLARSLALLFLSTLFYLFSFQWLWLSSPHSGSEELTLSDWSVLLDALIGSGVTAFAWWKLGYRRGSLWHLDLTSAVVGTLLLATGAIAWWSWRVESLGAIAVLIFNAFLFLLALGLLRESLATGQRRGFWLGILLAALQLISRLLEYNTSLFFRAIVLFLCGLGVIAAGLWFERYLRAFRPLADLPPSQNEEHST